MIESWAPKFKRNPNAMVHSAYAGVASGNRTMTRFMVLNKDTDRIDKTATYGAGIPRGQGGRIATLVLGGMETTLDEIEYILEGAKEKKFIPKRGSGEIADMCRLLAERRNDRIKHLRKNPSEVPRPKVLGPIFHLPVGYKMMQTPEPGFRMLRKV